MEDMYVKPGNQERGWNDPPQFSYGLQMARGPQKNLLSRRSAPPSACGAPPAVPPTSSPLAAPSCGVVPPPLHPGAPPTVPPTSSPLAPPPCGVEPPRLHPATPPPLLGPKRLQTNTCDSQSESEPDVEVVVSVLRRALDSCRQEVSAQVCSDVAKRLRLLEDSWRSGRLSLPVRRRMNTLALELQSGNWDSADEIHRSLMVDHVTEVSLWMVGVKRLIAETRNLSPERLQPLQGHVDEVQNCTEPSVQDPAEPTQNTISQS